MDRKKFLPEIAPFIKKIKKEFHPEKLILFGSRATGSSWKRSDYDFLVVSSKFKNVHWLKRISKVVQFWDVVADIDVLPYTPQEFEEKRKQIGIVRRAVKEGIAL